MEVESRVEAMIPEVHRLVAGRLTAGRGYATWRTSGTDDWLLIHTVGGAGRVGGTDDGELVLERGDAILIAPRVRHDYGTARDSETWEVAYSHFHPRPEWLPLLAWPQPVGGIGRIQTGGEMHRRIVGALRRMARLSVGGLARAELFAVNALEEALLWLETQNPQSTRMDERVLTVIEHVETHLAEPIDVAGLADIVHLSPSRLTHLFTEQLATSPQRYVERQRMLLAERLLEFTNRPIAVVAQDVGFADPLYFSQRFRRFAGSSPSAYRRNAGARS